MTPFTEIKMDCKLKLDLFTSTALSSPHTRIAENIPTHPRDPGHRRVNRTQSHLHTLRDKPHENHINQSVPTRNGTSCRHRVGYSLMRPTLHE